MKILYVITKSNWGGAQRHVYDLATEMKEKGHSAIVALGGDGVLRKKLDDAGVKTYPIDSLARDVSIKKDNGSFKKIFSIIKRERPDVVHLHSPKAAGLGALASRILGIKKIVYTVHGWTFNENRPLHERLTIAFFSWMTMILVSKVILLSEKEYAQTTRFPFVKNKLVLSPNGMRPMTFVSIDGARQVIGKLIGVEATELGKKTITGTVGELHANKGLFYLINAMENVYKEHPDTISVIIGDGEEAASLQFLIKEKGLEKNIFLAGYVENAMEYLKAFNIFVFPSVKEGLPYALMEAAYASLPVITTTVGGIPEIVEDMKSGVLVQAKNSRELSHAISFAIEHPKIARQYGVALRERVVNKFSLADMVRRNEGVYLMN